MIRSMPEDFGKEVWHASCIRIYIFIRRVRVMKGIREIAITDMPEVSIGNVQSDEAKTGVTVLLFDKKGAVVGVDISGGGPASRETPLTSPVTADNPINAIVLSGGSAYGLAAADGVMRCLEDHGIGFETGYARVPLVCQSCIYDLGYGSATVRPDSANGICWPRESAGRRQPFLRQCGRRNRCYSR